MMFARGPAVARERPNERADDALGISASGQRPERTFRITGPVGLFVDLYRSPYDVVRTLLGVVLLLAATLKGHKLATEPVSETSLLTSRWFLIVVVESELAFGLWLLAALCPKSTRATALLCFSVFAGASLFKAVSGEQSCNCFGSVPVNPWWTFAFDSVVLAALLRFGPVRRDEGVGRISPSLQVRVAAVAGLWLLVGVPAGIAMGSYRGGTLSEFGGAGFVVLRPESWLGQRLPILGHIDVGDQLAHGNWIVVLYHHDCPECREAIPRYKRFASEHKNDTSVAFIEIPPYADSNSFCGPPCEYGRLSDSQEWFVRTPTEVTLKDGVVVRVRGPNGSQHRRPTEFAR